ncbi:DUF805 domain-containing protein [Pelagibacterium mangrovi]|uniref:DUF805 domain-containing protein n=1 Tax=Pelagibacterium mangrovi TaxID=3119828 RepID=UPI002FC724E3
MTYFLGRISRAQFVKFFILMIGASLVSALVVSWLASTNIPDLATFVGVIWTVAAAIISFSFAVRRCHDLGLSGWLALSIFVPIINIFMIIVLLFKEGNPFANTYGNPPRETVSSSASRDEREFASVVSQKRVVIGTLIVALIAILFPPWGYLGQNFDQFAFPLSRDVYLTNYRNIPASIVWHILGLELVAIGIVGAVGYVLAPSGKAPRH